MLAENQVEVLFEFHPLLRLDACIEQQLEQNHLLLVLGNLLHLDYPLI